MRVFVFVIGLLSFIDVFSQCSGGINGGAITPTTSWQTVSVLAGRYYTFTVVAGTCDTYDFTFCQGGGSAGFDTQLTVRTNTDTYAGGYNDDNCSLQSQIMGWTPTGAGTYRILVNNYNCASSGASATLAFRKISPNTNANYIYLNNATSTGNCIQLTAATNDQKGCAWDVNSTLIFAANFSYDFTVNLGSSDGGADGMAFVMQNDPAGLCACGVSGGSLGAGGITNSVIVEIDTYLNTEDRDDGMTGVTCAGGPEPDHLDIWLNGNVNPYADCSFQPPGARVVPNAVRLMNGASIYNIENGANHILRISWNSGSSTLTASVLNTALTTTYGTISYTFNPITVFGTNTPYFGFTASTGGLSNQQTYCLPNVLLPVTFLSFEGSCENENSILAWQTATEQDNEYFFLERSSNGIDFSTIAVIPGAMNSSQLLNYRFEDNNAPKGLNYYRLSQVDINGISHTLNNYVKISCSDADEFMVYVSNPGQIEINNLTPQDGVLTLQLFDVSGKLMHTETMDRNQNSKNVQMSKISSGIYFLNILSENQLLYQYKVFIQL